MQNKTSVGPKKTINANDFSYDQQNIIETKTIIDAKVVLLGDSAVGKSSIAQRYVKNNFSENYDVTIGGAYMQ